MYLSLWTSRSTSGINIGYTNTACIFHTDPYVFGVGSRDVSDASVQRASQTSIRDHKPFEGGFVILFCIYLLHYVTSDA